MCGVFALFYRRPLNDDDLALARAGTQALRHRGPDSAGEWFDRERGVFLGHRRLKIIDLTEASHQPMRHDDVVLSYNGEIYNFRDLRRRLEERGVRFRSTGDTEVLLRAWQAFGPSALDLLDGMFAFALWDGDTGWLAIDPFGEKQLYVAETGDGVIVSSELTPLAQALGARPALTTQHLVSLLALGFIAAPQTAYPGIGRLTPATVAMVRNGGIVDTRRYWRPAYGTPGRGRVRPLNDRELDNLNRRLVESVAGRLEADVPGCVFLSSGVDSTLVAAIAARELDHRLDAVTVSFPDGGTHDEAPAAAAIAAELGMPHAIVANDADGLAVEADDLFDLFGQPNDNVTVDSVRQMARTAKARGYKVGLTGMGGDELFLGYLKHSFFYRNRRIYRLPEKLRLAIGSLLRPTRNFHSRFQAFCAVAAVTDSERYFAVKNLPAGAVLRDLPGYAEWTRSLFPNDGPAIEQAVPLFDLGHVMPNSQLPAYDLGSMRASVEFRTPFLNRTLQETIAEFDPRAFLAFGQKSVMRRILARYLPDGLTYPRKRGFVYPVDGVLAPLGDRAPDVDGLPAETIHRIWARRRQAGWKRLAMRVWLASQLDRWARSAAARDNPSPAPLIAAGTDD